MRHYTEIDIFPIFQFNKCKDGDLQYLYMYSLNKIKTGDIPKKYPPGFVDVYYNMLYQFDHLDPKFARLLNRIARFDNLYVQTLDKKYLNKKNLLIAEYENSLKNIEQSEQSFTDQFAAVKRWTGLDLDMFTTSTKEYYAHIEAYKQFELKQAEINGKA